ncbi:MAG: hypothetical protein EOO46_25675, partial [Flavobacterium sp.]
MPNNLSQASKLAQLDSLGSSKADFDMDGQLPVLSQIAGEFIKRVQNNIQSAKLNATGKMSRIEIETLPDGINILAEKYLVYHDQGVSGTQRKFNTPFAYTNKMPPIDKIKEWIVAVKL